MIAKDLKQLINNGESLTVEFKEIGRADELGSGVRNLFKYSKIYSGAKPQLLEADIFRTIIPIRNIKNTEKTEGAFEGAFEEIITKRISKITNKTKDKLIILLKSITKNEGERVPFYSKTIHQIPMKSIERYIKYLKDIGIIEFKGEASQKGGYYLTEEIRNLLKTNN